jgi:Tfp pilus assembly protein PilF
LSCWPPARKAAQQHPGRATRTEDRVRPDRSEKRANIRLQLAVGYYSAGKLEIALDEVKQAIAADPDMPTPMACAR